MNKYFSVIPKYLLSLTILFFYGWICLSAVSHPETQARIIYNKMIAALDANTGSTYLMHSNERLVHSKDMNDEQIFTKVNARPLKVYLKVITGGNKGTEILYIDGEDNNKALVNPGKFLPDLHLSPSSGLMVKNEHHTLVKSGFAFINAVMKTSVRRMDERGKFDSNFKYEGEVTWNGRSCYKIVIDDDSWTYTTYVAHSGETMSSISLKRLVPEYSLMELDGIKSFEEDLGDKALKLPTVYAKRTVLYIDKANNYPVYQEMSDENGVFERYEYQNLVVNPTYKADEFNRDFADYKF